MNELSWLIYAVDVVPKVATLFAVIAFLILLPIIGICFLGLKVFDTTKAEQEKCRRTLKVVFLPFIFLCLLVVVIPSRETLMLIAASEMGVPDTASKAHRALNKWLDDYLLGVE